MVYTPDHVDYVKGMPVERWEEELKGVCPGAPISPGLLDGITHLKYGRVAAKKIVLFVDRTALFQLRIVCEIDRYSL